MYRCYATGTVAPPRTPTHKVTILVRRKEYPPRFKAIPVSIPGKRSKVHRDDPGGVGFEIVQEVMMCEAAALAFKQLVAEHPAGVEALTDPLVRDQLLNAVRNSA
ncbi:MAG: hypothetical protein H6741_25205 [Alphaproteobacteria bacterium]|nr:hypothetical protein [Alphaproteobacteria bacterium]MCB9796008.1 hypothetical protein [Alphaproteobacteria bacterium]